MESTHKPITKRVLLIGGAVCSVLLVYYTLHRYGSLDYLQQQHTVLQEYVRTHNVTAPLIYLLGIACCTLSALPATMLLTILGGYLFGTLAGTLYTAVGATIGATAGCALIRSAVGRHLQARYAQQLAPLNTHLEQYGVRYLLAIRLVPVVPFFMVTILGGCTQIPLTTFAATTLAGSVPLFALYAYLGHYFTQVTCMQEFFTPHILGLLALLMLCASLSLVFPHRAKLQRLYITITKKDRL